MLCPQNAALISSGLHMCGSKQTSKASNAPAYPLRRRTIISRVSASHGSYRTWTMPFPSVIVRERCRRTFLVLCLRVQLVEGVVFRPPVHYPWLPLLVIIVQRESTCVCLSLGVRHTVAQDVFDRTDWFLILDPPPRCGWGRPGLVESGHLPRRRNSFWIFGRN